MILSKNTPEAIAQAVDCIRAGGLLGLPTETVYGLAADADNDAAVAQIFQAKGRPADHPLIVHVADVNAVAHYASEVPAFARQLMQAFWPGPLTLILPRRPGVANAAAGGNPTIGLRCPSHPVAQALLKVLTDGGQIPIHLQSEKLPEKQLESDPRYFGESVMARSEAARQSMPLCVWGLAAPSANQFGRVSPTTAAHVQAEFGSDLLILDGGSCDVGIESTIIDCTRGTPVLLRPGAITPQQIQAACGLKVLLKDEMSAARAPAPKASGTLESHYAPKAKVRLMDARALQTALDLIGADVDTTKKLSQASQSPQSSEGPVIATWSRVILKTPSRTVLQRRMPGDATSAAQQLFAVLREFDDRGVKLIWIESPPDSSEWEGVRDRLQRAAT